jgi:Xaa-Pro aminopeptidase
MYKVAQEAIVQSDCLPLWSSIRFGRNMAYGTISDSTPLRKGDSIWFDIGCTYLGYRSDIGRTLSFGEPSPKMRRLYDAIKAGQDLALQVLMPGVTAGQVFAKTVERVRESGIPEYKRRHVGHGIGIEWYELPRLVPDSDFVIDLGAVMEVETPYYELGFGGAMLEDLAVVTPDGAQVFTELDRHLGIIGT